MLSTKVDALFHEYRLLIKDHKSAGFPLSIYCSWQLISFIRAFKHTVSFTRNSVVTATNVVLIFDSVSWRHQPTLISFVVICLTEINGVLIELFQLCLNGKFLFDFMSLYLMFQLIFFILTDYPIDSTNLTISENNHTDFCILSPCHNRHMFLHG